jgi:hypothetical protein
MRFLALLIITLSVHAEAKKPINKGARRLSTACIENPQLDLIRRYSIPTRNPKILVQTDDFNFDLSPDLLLTAEESCGLQGCE